PYAEQLRHLGIVPYRHQAKAFEALQAGSDLVIATPTASGKSLVFQVPAVTAALAGGTSFMLYPTKALAHDQLGRLRAVAAGLASQEVGGAEHGAATIDTYDGDTPSDLRVRVR